MSLFWKSNMYQRTLLLLFTVLVAVCGQKGRDDDRQSGNPLINFFEAPLRAFKVQQGEAVAVFEPEVVQYNETGIGSWLRRQGLVGSTGSLTNWLTRRTPSTTAKPVQTIYIQQADIVDAVPNRYKPQDNNNNNNNNGGNNRNKNKNKNKKKKPTNNGNEYNDNYDDNYYDYDDYYEDDYDGDYPNNKPDRFGEHDDYSYDEDDVYYDDEKPTKAKPNKNRPSKYDPDVDQYDDDDGYEEDYDEDNYSEEDDSTNNSQGNRPMAQTVRRTQNRRQYAQQNRHKFNQRRGGNNQNRRRQQNFGGQNVRRKTQQFQNNNFANTPNKPKRQRPTTRPLRAPQNDQVVVVPVSLTSAQKRPNRNRNQQNKNRRPTRPQSDFVPMNHVGSIAFIPNGEPIPLSDENGTPIVPYNPLIPNPPFKPLNRTELLLLAGQSQPQNNRRTTTMKPQGGDKNKNKMRRCKNNRNRRGCRRPNTNNQNQNQNNDQKPENDTHEDQEREDNQHEESEDATENTPMELEKHDDESDASMGSASEEDANIPLEGREINFHLPQRYFPLLGSDSYLAVANNGRFLLKSARELRHVEDEANLEEGAVKAVQHEVLDEVKQAEEHPEKKPEATVELKAEDVKEAEVKPEEVPQVKSEAEEQEKTEVENVTAAPPVLAAEIKSTEVKPEPPQQETFIPVHVINPLPIEDHDAKPKLGGQVTLVHPVDTTVNATPEEKEVGVSIVHPEPAVKSETVAEETLPEPVPVQSPAVESEVVSPVEQP